MRDVIVVGGGPVGILLACLLAERGVDVEVLERRTEPSMLARAIGIHPPSMRVLGQAGVAEQVLARAVRIEAGSVQSGGRTLGRLSFARMTGRFPFVVALPQHETEAVLRARFEQLRPDGLRSGVGVGMLHDRGHHVDVIAEPGVGTAVDASDEHDGDTGLEIVGSARYVVVADGARGQLRDAVGIASRPLGGGETYLMADYPDTGEHGSEAVLFFERGGVVESFPLPNGRRRWVAMTPALMPDASIDELTALVLGRTGVLLPASDAQPSSFSVRQRLAATMVQGRVLLAGDAAHEISPIGGQGMNLGWLDAVALAPALTHALAQPIEARVTLAGYDRRRRRSARMAARQAGFNMAMGRPARGLRLRLRNVVVRVLATPPLNSLLTRAFTMRWL
ncbi:NAD(P)/FAD-dependent oxidoreductase [Cryobacterium sp. SO1]|uniref:FAD-dependent oxidoreductase n=1 Tax=Cryobacterium sp. SO1 TaxID=1897061 RepID=UPI001023600A|nr:NAD(P)/FAD-dependent oxidoreductase [Cryobacterium sp. SO1]RZI34040.1 Pentachlorophenol 4-monooxygenase [Cryobacterium sp. SO1]